MAEEINKIAKGQQGGNHYQSFKIQPLEYCYHNNIPSIESSVIKYVSRHKFKNGAEDLKKAIHLLQTLLELEYSENDSN